MPVGSRPVGNSCADSLAATGLRVTAQTAHGDRDVKRASVDFDLDALAVPDSVARRGRNSATVTGIGQGDLGQVAQSMRDRDGYPAHDDTRAGTSAGGAELRWYCRQIPANGLIAAMPGQYIPLFFQPGAGMSVAFGIPVKLASDLVAVRRAPVCWQQIEQRALVLVGLVLGPSHAKNLAGHLRQVPTGTSQPAPPSMPLSLPGRKTNGTAVRQSRAARVTTRRAVRRRSRARTRAGAGAAGVRRARRSACSPARSRSGPR